MDVRKVVAAATVASLTSLLAGCPSQVPPEDPVSVAALFVERVEAENYDGARAFAGVSSAQDDISDETWLAGLAPVPEGCTVSRHWPSRSSARVASGVYVVRLALSGCSETFTEVHVRMSDLVVVQRPAQAPSG